jgi:hypothetical protein
MRASRSVLLQPDDERHLVSQALLHAGLHQVNARCGQGAPRLLQPPLRTRMRMLQPGPRGHGGIGGSNVSNEEDEASRRFDIDLNVVHPTLRPSEISKALGLVAHVSHAVGEPRKTPKGKRLPGAYTDTRWRHKRRYTVEEQWFGDELADFVESLRPRSEALAMLRATGGMTALIIQFVGEGHFGDEIGYETLSTILELGLSLEIECFAIPRDE